MAKRPPRRPVVSENGGWTALTPERQEKIVENIGRGVHLEVAARAAGIDSSNLRRWMVMGQDKVSTDEATGERLVTRAPEPFRSFRAAVEDAEAALELRLVDRYRDVSETAAFGNATHIAGFLGRRFRQRWDAKQTVELSGPEGGPVEVKGGSDADRLADVLGALARAGIVALPGAADSVPAGPDAEDE